jgi:LysR family transcriptional activator of nhaA
MSSFVANRMLKPVLRVGKPASIVVREDTLERLLAQLALGALDLVLSDSSAPPSPIKVHAHVLGESLLSLFAPASQAAALKRHFPRSLDGAPLLLPGEDSSVRQALERWFEAERLHPVIVGEFDGSTLMSLFAPAAQGIFPAPSAVEQEVRKQYGVAVIGRIPAIRRRYYGFSTERNPRHPSVIAVLRAARAAFAG